MDQLIGRVLSELENAAGALIAGIAGAVIAVSLLPRPTWRSVTTTLIAGVASSYYLPPLVAELLWYMWEINRSSGVYSSVGFLCGLIGMNLVSGAFRLSDQWQQNPTFDPRNIWRKKDKP